MTKREFFTAITVFAAGETPVDAEGNTITLADLSTMATDEIAKLDAANEKKKEKAAAKASENQPLIDALLVALTSTPKTASELKDVIECSVQKTSAILRGMVANGLAQVQDVKAAKGTVKGYTIA